MELGTAPITAAWERGEAVAAFTEGQQWPGLIFATDSSQIGRIVRREAQALPPISCGDKMRLHPKDLPLSWARALGWKNQDSLTVRWQCLDQTDLADLGQRLTQASAQPAAEERLWMAALKSMDPEYSAPAQRRYQPGEKVHLSIACQRPDGSHVGDTIRLDFRFGETGQVVDALQPGLAQAGPGAHWSVWALSSKAFGSQRQSKLLLEAHTPLKFTVVAE